MNYWTYIFTVVVLRAKLGPGLQIVCLAMALEDQLERVRERNVGDKSVVDLMKVILGKT